MKALRVILAVLMLACSLALVGCSADRTLQTITVSPSSQELTAVGQTVQFRAIATYTKGTHPTTTRDVTSEVQWSSSNAGVATIDAKGLATAVGGGETEISASLGGTLGVVTGAARVNVDYASGSASHDVLSISIIPSSQSVGHVGETNQYIAIGTFNSDPVTADVTNVVHWSSSDVMVGTINSTGLATAVNSGSTTITATMSTASDAVLTANATFSVQPDGGGVQISSLTVYSVGQGTGAVTSADGVINCATAGAPGCTGHFSPGTTVTLTATPDAGFRFGGWSANCVPTDQPTCSVTMTGNESVGAIFNLQQQ